MGQEMEGHGKAPRRWQNLLPRLRQAAQAASHAMAQIEMQQAQRLIEQLTDRVKELEIRGFRQTAPFHVPRKSVNRPKANRAAKPVTSPRITSLRLPWMSVSGCRRSAVPTATTGRSKIRAQSRKSSKISHRCRCIGCG